MDKALIFALLCASCLGQSILRPIMQKQPTGGGGGATWTHIQDCNASSSLVCVFGANPTQHDTVAIYIGSTTVQTAAACADGNSNAYTVSATKGGGTTGGLFAYVAYLLDAPANANKTITCSGFGAGFHDVQGTQGRDSGGTQTLDQVVGSADPVLSAPAILFPTFTPATAGSFAYCGVLPNNGISAVGGSWTLSSNNNSASEYQTNIAASATSANFTDTASSDNYATICIVFKP